MKRILALVVVVFFAASATVAFAEVEKKEQNLFKIINSTIKPGTVKEKNKLKNLCTTAPLFKNMGQEIKDGAAQAKGESLRTKNTK